MKKVFLCLLCLFMVTGCGNGGTDKSDSEKVDFPVLDSKVNYVVVKGKKIYLATNYSDFYKQFEGMGCYVSKDKSIDEIIKNDELNTTNGHIYCYLTEEKSYLDSVNVTIMANETGVYYWSFSIGNYDVVTDNGTILFGDEDRTASTLEQALNVLGNNYETEESSFSSFRDYSYEDGNIEYSFSYNVKGDYIANFHVVRNQ